MRLLSIQSKYIHLFAAYICFTSFIYELVFGFLSFHISLHIYGIRLERFAHMVFTIGLLVRRKFGLLFVVCAGLQPIQLGFSTNAPANVNWQKKGMSTSMPMMAYWNACGFVSQTQISPEIHPWLTCFLQTVCLSRNGIIMALKCICF